MERGAIPLLIRDGKWVEYHLDDIRLISGRAYLPHRMTQVSSNPSGVTRVTDLTVISTDFEHKPAASSYKLSFPSKKPMVNAAAMLVYGPSDSWDLMNLPSSNSPGTRKVVMSAPGAATPPPPALPAEREAKSLWGTVLLILGGILAIFGFLLGWRFIHVRRGTSQSVRRS